MLVWFAVRLAFQERAHIVCSTALQQNPQQPSNKTPPPHTQPPTYPHIPPSSPPSLIPQASQHSICPLTVPRTTLLSAHPQSLATSQSISTHQSSLTSCDELAVAPLTSLPVHLYLPPAPPTQQANFSAAPHSHTHPHPTPVCFRPVELCCFLPSRTLAAPLASQ